MTPADDITVESIIKTAEGKGLSLTEEDGAKLLSGVKRNRAMADQLRSLISADLEPALTFAVPPLAGGKE